MKKSLLLGCASLPALSISTPGFAADPYFDSVIASVSDASGQAYTWLRKGTYRAEKSGTRMLLEIPAEMRSDLAFEVLNRTIQSGKISFQQPVFLTLRRGSVCVRLKIKKLQYGAAGIWDGALSDTTMSPPAGEPGCNDSEALAGLDDVLALNADMSQFFRGGFYAALAETKRCTNAACTTTVAEHPIRRAQFFSTAQPGFRATFQEGSTIVLPQQGFIRLASGSYAAFNSLTYDFTDQSGTADLRGLNLGANEGVIAGGTTLLKLAAGSQVKIDQMQVAQGKAARFEMKNGSVSGRLGEGTTIGFGSVQGKPSSVQLINADVSLAGLSISSHGSSTTLSAQRGQFQSRVKQADLWLAPDMNLRLGYTNLNFFLGCPEQGPAPCTPVEWGSTGAKVRGTIAEFATQITGGQFPFSNAGATRIGQGSIEAGTLTLDSTRSASPVTGQINKLDLKFSGEDIVLDPQTRIRAALVTLSSSDLKLVDGETLPAGTLDVAGEVTRIIGGALGGVATGDGKLKLRISRKNGDEPEVKDGELMARSHIRLEGNNYADGTIEVRNFNYYRGHGSARLKLTVDKASYTITTPNGRRTEDNSVAKVEVNVRPAQIPVSLAQAFVVGPLDINASGSTWRIQPATQVPLKLALDIPRHELVYAPIKEKALGSTLCAPKVHLAGQRMTITSKVDLWASSGGSRVRVYDPAASGPVDASVDDNGCSEVGALICGLIGSVGGPMGAIALGIICHAKIEEKEGELSNSLRDKSIELVEQFHFDYDF